MEDIFLCFIGAGQELITDLLIEASGNSSGRFLLLSSLDEGISTREEIYRLATHKYPDLIYSEVFKHLSEFIPDSFHSGFISQVILP